MGQNFIVYGPPQTFLACTSPETGLLFSDMLFEMCQKILHMSGVGAERDVAAAAKLVSAIFQNVVAPTLDKMFGNYFEELWERALKAETPALRRAVLGAFASMV